jgi:hypothetical protein
MGLIFTQWGSKARMIAHGGDHFRAQSVQHIDKWLDVLLASLDLAVVQLLTRLQDLLRYDDHAALPRFVAGMVAVEGVDRRTSRSLEHSLPHPFPSGPLCRRRLEDDSTSAGTKQDRIQSLLDKLHSLVHHISILVDTNSIRGARGRDRGTGKHFQGAVGPHQNEIDQAAA